MIHEYTERAIKKAEYKKLEDGTWFGEIPGFEGVWANGDSLENCRHELIDVLEEWLILKLRDDDPVPAVDGLTIKIEPISAAS
jgi:predicted RNase H-like HicB family nuclease